MADPMLTQIPQTINAGDTVKWTKTFDAYPADEGWSLNYRFINSKNNFSVSTTASGKSFVGLIAAADSQDLKAGDYAFRGVVTKTGESYTVDEGKVTIRPFFSSQTFDTRSPAKIALDNINAYLLDSKNLSASQYTIAGRTLQRYSMSDLLRLKSRFEMEVSKEAANEKTAAGLADPRRVFVRFGK